MTAYHGSVPQVLDWLVVGDIALERSDGKGTSQPILGGAGARLAAHGASLGAKVALVAKTGEDEAGERALAWLQRLRVDLTWTGAARGYRTTIWHEPPGRPQARRVERGADLALRLDEIPSPAAAPARLTVVSGYSLSVEPARSAAVGALRVAPERGGRSAMQLEAELLWWTNPRMTRKVLEPALAVTHSVALTASDARTLFGPRVQLKDALRELSRLGPHLIFMSDAEGGALLQEGARLHVYRARDGAAPIDRYAGPAAFWVAHARGIAPRQAASIAVRHAQAIQHAGAPRSARPLPLSV